MRHFDQTVVRTLSFVLVGSGLVIACSSASSVTTDTDAGTGDAAVTETGPLPDSGQPDNAAPPTKCAKDEECPSGVCNLATGTCNPANCKDGVKNSNETDLDCGGDCSKCDTGKTCKVGADCSSGVCKDTGMGLKCQAPTNSDGVKNGLETGIDCGGAGNPKCADGQGCKGREDCTSDFCKTGICTAITPGDGVQNGNETDVDCGGVGNARCNDNLKCLVADDCKSSVCMDTGGGLTCQPPSYTDGVKNGTETDVDCGGDPTMTYACTAGKTCLVGDDCSSRGCNHLFQCAAGRSCTNAGGYGSTTCGFGGEGSIGPAQWEDCCAKASVTPTSGPTNGVPVMVDKYLVTGGRMRVFMESIGYNVRAFVQQARADGKVPVVPGNVQGRTVLEPDWDMYLPISFAGTAGGGELSDCDQGGAQTPTSTVCNPGTEIPGIYSSVRSHLGATIFKGNNQSSTGCVVGSAAKGGGTHVFRFPDNVTAAEGGGTPSLDQNGYDMKAMNCIDYLVGQAFCVWEGGRLILGPEHLAMWGPSAMPWAADSTQTPAEPGQRCDGGGTCLTAGDKTYWGCRFPWALDATHPDCGLTWPANTSIEYADYKYSYEWPKVNPSSNIYDYIGYISAPGRTRGRGPFGHADVIGTNMSLMSNLSNFVLNGEGKYDPQTVTHGWTSGGSWEVHNYNKNASGQGFSSNLLNKYGKLGLRCVFPN